jgi:hypothetical protein
LEESTSTRDRSQTIKEFLRIIRGHWRMVVAASALVTAIVAVVAGVYLLWGQPTLRTLVLEFRPTFRGANEGRYPNELPFAGADVIAPSVLDAVYKRSALDQYCDQPTFRSGFFVEQQGAELRFLDAEYQARLSDPRLTSVERDRVQAEYRARRAALPVHFRLVFAIPSACSDIPEPLASKALYDALEEWAKQGEEQRGVLRLNVPLLTPGMLDVAAQGGAPQLVQADLLRTRLLKIAHNISRVEANGGAPLVRLPNTGVSFAEIRTKIEDLVQTRLEPLIVSAGRSAGGAPLAWIDETLAAARRDQAAAEGRAEAYRTALREYSGQPQGQAIQPTQASRPGEVQTLAPQIDRTFIDRILEMSTQNVAFRQRMTEEMVKADVGAMDSRARTAYYEHLASAVRSGGPIVMTGTDLSAALTQLAQDGKALAQQFSDLYELFARNALRIGGAMYLTDSPVQRMTYRPFTARGFLAVTFVTLLLSLIIAVLFYVMRARIRALVSS